jgi:hypothetical protein
MRGLARATLRNSESWPSYTVPRLNRCRVANRSFSWSICLGLSYGLLAGMPHAESQLQAQFAARAEG